MKYLLVAALVLTTLLPTSAFAARFYVDGTCTTPGNGTSPTCSGANAPLATLRSFTDVARVAGDVAIVRRTATTTAIGVALSVTTDGTLNAPITVQADMDNAFGDFATSSQTFTAQLGSRFMASSASTTDAFPKKWLYVAGDCYENPTSVMPNGCGQYYQIKNATSTGIELFFPYNGSNNGSGKNIRLAPELQLSITTNTLAVFSMSNDDYWVIDGVTMRSSATTGTFNISSSKETTLRNVAFETDGTSAIHVLAGLQSGTYIKKVRGFRNSGNAFPIAGADIDGMYIDCDNVATTQGLPGTAGNDYKIIKNVYIDNCTQEFTGTTGGSNILIGRNVFRDKNLFGTLTGNNYTRFYFEDDLNTPGLTSHFSNQNSVNTSAGTTTMSSTTNLRSGGGPTNLYVAPPSGTGNTGLSDMNFPHSYIKLFEYPIYTDTSSKTYTMYFNSTSTALWSVDPTTSVTSVASTTPELFIECEYYANDANVERVTKRSNTENDVDFNGSTTWQDVAVTCQPARSGILYLRGWYGKKKETGAAMNLFYMDTTPVIN